MKNKISKFATGFLIFGVAISGCSSAEKASATDTTTVNKPTVPDTTRSPLTHMDTSKKPPM